MKLYRVEVVGTWDVMADSEAEAEGILAEFLPPRVDDTGVDQSNVKVDVLEEVTDENL